MNANSCIKLVYILGFGRSGSTLLDMLLGSLDGVFSTGEVWALGKWIEEDKNCSCGESVSSCPIWGKVIDDINAVVLGPPADLYRQNEIRRSRLAEMLALISEHYLFPYNGIEVQDFSQKEHFVFCSLSKITGAKVFVDSSKHLHRLSRLVASDDFDIRVIHLVRDGRALLEAAHRARKRGVLKNESSRHG